MQNVKLTFQRKAIYDVLKESSDHPTASDVIERLRAKEMTFAYGTVYNSLRYLTKVGLIRELKLGETMSRYDARVDDHQHVVCTQCGKVDEVYAEIPEEWLQAAAKESGYSIEKAKVVLEGVCGECTSSAEQAAD